MVIVRSFSSFWLENSHVREKDTEEQPTIQRDFLSGRQTRRVYLLGHLQRRLSTFPVRARLERSLQTASRKQKEGRVGFGRGAEMRS